MVGLSSEWHRPSNFAAKYMQQHGYRIVPVNPRYAEVLGETLLSVARGDPVPGRHGRRVPHAPRDVLPIARSAVDIGAKCLWQQLGVRNLEADRLARDAGLDR